MRLAIVRLATCLPEAQQHDNLLGSIVPAAYRHLYDPAGNHSRPPTVRRGSMRQHSPHYRAPTAPVHLRTSDMASQAVARALEGAPDLAERVGAVFHTHCTLDQQILASSCLRVAHDHFRHVGNCLSVGQLGTAGIPTALRLFASTVGVDSTELACISASDKWVAPMVRRIPGLITYGDASAACVVGVAGRVAAPLAVIEAIHTVSMPLPHDQWTAAPEVQRAFVLELAGRAIDGLRPRFTDVDHAQLVLCGDSYGASFADALQRRCGITGSCLSVTDGETHLSSAAPLFALECVIAAGSPTQALRAVIWSASTAGHAGALLVTVPPRGQTSAANQQGDV